MAKIKSNKKVVYHLKEGTFETSFEDFVLQAHGYREKSGVYEKVIRKNFISVVSQRESTFICSLYNVNTKELLHEETIYNMERIDETENVLLTMAVFIEQQKESEHIYEKDNEPLKHKTLRLEKKVSNIQLELDKKTKLLRAYKSKEAIHIKSLKNELNYHRDQNRLLKQQLASLPKQRNKTYLKDLLQLTVLMFANIFTVLRPKEAILFILISIYSLYKLVMYFL